MTIKHLYPNARPSLDLKFAKDKVLDPRITYSRASSGTYFDSTGTLQSAATNQARFDHDPTTGESLGLLVEEARTNSQTNSTRIELFTPVELNIIPNALLAPDGTFTGCALIGNTANSYKYAINPVGFSVSGTTHSFSFYAKSIGNRTSFFVGGNSTAWGSGSVTFDLSAVTATATGSFTGSITAAGNGWYRCVATRIADASGYGINIYLDTFQGDGVSGIGIWGLQAEAGSFPTSYIPTPATFTSRSTTATYYDANGTIQTAAIDVARDDAYFPDENGVMRPAGLLLEAAGTNYIDESVNLTDTGTWYNYKFLTPTLNAGTAPDGTNTATSLVPNTENINRAFQCVNIATTFQGTLTVSVFAKANGYNKFALFIDGASAGGAFGGGANFDLSTGTVTQGASGVGTITKLPNGWYRCAVTHTNTAQAFTVWPGIGGLDNSGNTVWAGDGTSGYLFWGFQLEASPYPTSYIPTTTSTVTRAADVSSSSTVTRSADVAQITGSNFSSWYNQSEGTLYQDCTTRISATALASNAGVGALLLGSGFSRVGFFRPATTTTLSAQVYTGTVFSANLAFAAAWTQGVPSRAALAYRQDSFAASANGATPLTDTSGTVPILNSLDIGRMSTATYNRIGAGTFARLTYYPVRLPDATLQTITS